ncbi:xanthine dehydrogenase family protein molybdopterin-binding subunit [Pseudomaricurvus alkylphenolicus]|uniref:xanthine dehydrogenase family protein molybdopterin-binding subunit n=1 Tax=Pseudomaricurvus alkylphenolicus TaxID=1306991 RepID=UPI00141E3541|nr:xanthine dehydrogenase family protein molybdopterin-binding subunit [Pseudomaricurvus alkylphenolicus]NIB43977.1 xanthine dehydrogenase family protein molybdopterin-binding subunit [Pseudomaricurvus alkylphenolicus]
MSKAISSNRRDFLKMMGITGGGLVLGVPLSGCASAQSRFPYAAEDAWQADAFLQVTPSNQVRFFVPQAEMGQGVNMGLTTLIAEELNMDPATIEVRTAGIHKDYGVPGYGIQVTGGSASIRVRYEPLRQSAAQVRELLLQAASLRWGVSKNQLSMADAKISSGDRTEGIGAFVVDAAELPAPESVELKPDSELRWIGRDRGPRIDALAKATGTADFGIDAKIPGMKKAALLRSPVAGGKVLSFALNGADQQAGVHKVVEIFNGVAVVAEHYWQARKALEQIEVKWELPALSSVSSDALGETMAEALNEEGQEAHKQGEGAKALREAASTLSARYEAPFLAHATMEPMNCTVHMQGDRAEAWVPTQAPDLAGNLVSEYGGIDRDKVQVHSTYLGGGFGRRAFHDFVAEATAIARKVKVPVQLTWSREDDTRNDYYRPAATVDLAAGLDEQGQLQTWSAKRAGANIMPYMLDQNAGALLPEFLPDGMVDWVSKRGYGLFKNWLVDPSSVEGLYEDYDVPNKEVRHVTVDVGIRTGYWRSVGHSFTGFFKESFMDELAHASEQDPLAFRLRHLPADSRLRKVLEAAAQKAGWGQPKNGRFLGIAAQESFESFVAEVAEVSVENGQIRVHKVTCAVDCGKVINPDIVRSQMESGVNFGLTAALYGEITFANGEVQQSNFHDYPMLRMNESPEIDVVLIDSDEHPTGVGEPGLPPIAPAVANAVFAATGTRLRSMPLRLS